MVLEFSDETNLHIGLNVFKKNVERPSIFISSKRRFLIIDKLKIWY